MKKSAIAALGLAASAALTAVAEPAPGPYAGQQARDIKALAPAEVDDFLKGKGMGLAKAAELNGYPGPSHVLALAAELGLSAEQRRRTEAVFRSMEQKAQAAGRELVEEERKLDRLFASRAIAADSLAQATARIGGLQAQVRLAHLEAHLAQAEILTPQQVQAYMRLRGYGDTASAADHSGHKH